ncbi:sulfur carrier protein ThiS [Gracilibacillus boraciitolerans JCM 21714]|uniref:Sulfur carrier protein ThiS n=1 Tax=Gracilibacillus boraciitolerans JCM 21714 TaxID=1298598 RepID=W4VLM1_9BACI|nr:sulfur carrier protein ThiS [Gracilibacillus boraciitolerans]GAE93669.1 sulfur carrier protein ThiS [Gracilibacillus boraciitolerans JCM 21714]
MKIRVNGEGVQLKQPIQTVEELLHHLNLEKKSLIIEHNHIILKKDQHRESQVSDGDQFEIVHFVGGG